MPNDYLSLTSSPRRSARLVEGIVEPPAPGTVERTSRASIENGSREPHPARWLSVFLLASLALVGCGGEEDDGITFEDDIQPLFNRRCTTCHHPSTPIGVDIQNPYAPERGLINAPNSWDVVHPEENMPAMNVVPFEPENSFLMNKLTGDLPANGNGGAVMPAQVPPVTPEELAILEQWVTEGAENNAFFEQNVRPIFGREDAGAGAFFGGKCIFCHYTGSPNPLDLSNPFGADGLVGVNATYRGDMVRVLPGDPEQSLLILKVRAERPDSDIGAQMPYSYDRLSDSQIERVRQWILEGARP